MTTSMDRIEPTRRPNQSVQGYQRWRNLLFLHWAVDADELRRIVPAELELDLWQDEAYVGVVPFAMEGVRHRWWPERLSMSFLETNVRTYVHYRGRPGVYFLSLDAESRLAVWGARVLWGLPYHLATMSMRHEHDRTTYQTVRRGNGASHTVVYSPGELIGPAEPGTADHFFLERYLLFVRSRGRILTGQVHHVPYPAQRVVVDSVDDQLIRAAGLSPSDRLAFAHFAAGVDVEIFPLAHRVPDRKFAEHKA